MSGSPRAARRAAGRPARGRSGSRAVVRSCGRRFVGSDARDVEQLAHVVSDRSPPPIASVAPRSQASIEGEHRQHIADSAAYGSRMPRALWVKAPFVLGRHRSVLLAVVCASFLVALAAASAPLLRAGAESEALKGKLQQLSPLAAGLTIETRGARDTNIAVGDEARRAAVVRLARSLPFVDAPLLTTIDGGCAGQRLGAVRRPPGRRRADGPHRRDGTRSPPVGQRARRVGRCDRRAACTRSSRRADRPRADFRGEQRTGYIACRVGAVYLPLDQDLDNPYWVNFLARIRSSNSDAPPLPTFLLMSQAELYRTARLTDGGFVANVFELPIAAGSMTPARAKEVAARFAALRHRLSRPTPLARKLGCPCRSSSSIEAAVTLARQSVAALTPVISLLAGFAAVIAIGAAFVAGVFNTRRRSAEARLSVVGGEPRAVYRSPSRARGVPARRLPALPPASLVAVGADARAHAEGHDRRLGASLGARGLGRCRCGRDRCDRPRRRRRPGACRSNGRAGARRSSACHGSCRC